MGAAIIPRRSGCGRGQSRAPPIPAEGGPLAVSSGALPLLISICGYLRLPAAEFATAGLRRHLFESTPPATHTVCTSSHASKTPRPEGLREHRVQAPRDPIYDSLPPPRRISRAELLLSDACSIRPRDCRLTTPTSPELRRWLHPSRTTPPLAGFSSDAYTET
ncbi:hypothetical protein U9M48_029860 [Paspalum notatum var. saurae]|uniref:Uncharacterized protein n=1 Tax=Paspalum notatum var. saurae TaxID=547442 RepID=A0AAQ3X2N5_PASNO